MVSSPGNFKDPFEEEYLSVQEAAGFLEISEGELRDLIRRHQIPTHQVAGAFLRLKKQEVEDLKIKWRIGQQKLFPQKEHFSLAGERVERPSVKERLLDFWYFNDFYILCSILIVLLLYSIVSSQ